MKVPGKVARLVGLGFLLFSPVGCSQRIGALTPAIQAQLMTEFRNGDAVLDCRLQCAGTWGYDQAELQSRYVTQNWQSLALMVMQIGFQEDLSYFYLGRAAEGLGAYEAALKYYGIAGAIATGPNFGLKCNPSMGLCAGFIFPRDLYPRIQAVELEMGQTRTVVYRRTKLRPKAVVVNANGGGGSRPKQTASTSQAVAASARDEPWVDPPPVTR